MERLETGAVRIDLEQCADAEGTAGIRGAIKCITGDGEGGERAWTGAAAIGEFIQWDVIDRRDKCVQDAEATAAGIYLEEGSIPIGATTLGCSIQHIAGQGQAIRINAITIGERAGGIDGRC